jgi:hypothetical protein
VLDEPTASLDFGNQGKVLREMRALVASGLGVLFTTHDPNRAVHAADRASLLRDGTRLACGDVKGVLTREKLEQLHGTPIERLVDVTPGRRCSCPVQLLVGGLERRVGRICWLCSDAKSGLLAPALSGAQCGDANIIRRFAQPQRSTLTRPTPENPIARAAPSDRSISRPRVNGPRSLTVACTFRP